MFQLPEPRARTDSPDSDLIEVAHAFISDVCWDENINTDSVFLLCGFRVISAAQSSIIEQSAHGAFGHLDTDISCVHRCE